MNTYVSGYNDGYRFARDTMLLQMSQTKEAAEVVKKIPAFYWAMLNNKLMKVAEDERTESAVTKLANILGGK